MAPGLRARAALFQYADRRPELARDGVLAFGAGRGADLDAGHIRRHDHGAGQTSLLDRRVARHLRNQWTGRAGASGTWTASGCRSTATIPSCNQSAPTPATTDRLRT